MISLVKGDITKDHNVQAIVNAANQSLLGGGGVDGAIHRAAGPKLLEECRRLNGCTTGNAKITNAYNLPCEHVIHTVGPIWNGGFQGEETLLSKCYENSLKLAVKNHIRTIAFPSISTGVYGYPVEDAARVALHTVNSFLSDHWQEIDEVKWVLFDDRTYQAYQKELDKLRNAGELYINKMLQNSAVAKAYGDAMDLGNLMTIAPHKKRYYSRYDINWLIDEIDLGKKHSYVTFWHENAGYENGIFSQWYHDPGCPIIINGREYLTAEQYMMSEKALLFGDLESYSKIMSEPSPRKCKQLGRGVKNFDQGIWDTAFREILFHGNLGKAQSDIQFLSALLDTEDAVLIEASPYDDIYGAGIEKQDLLTIDGELKVHPKNWHKEGSSKQAENNLGFVLMGIRDLYNDLMR
ncbi:MAG: O-acetyl-ADP-ribose deacetylase [Firmicutes bacterium]|nr:O-acetyl-ADP-ribose deacetylase [Bacillota bacterium]